MSNNIYLQYQNSVKSLGPFWALKKCKKAHFLYKKIILKGPLFLSCILVIFESFSFFEIIKKTVYFSAFQFGRRIDVMRQYIGGYVWPLPFSSTLYHALNRGSLQACSRFSVVLFRAILLLFVCAAMQKKVVFIYLNYCRKVEGVHNFIILYWVKLGKKR